MYSKKDPGFVSSVESFVRYVNTYRQEFYAKSYPGVTPSKVIPQFNSKYIKLVELNESMKPSRVFGFLDYSGNVLKAASWNAPAKHSRGNIFSDDFGKGAVTPHGIVYLN